MRKLLIGGALAALVGRAFGLRRLERELRVRAGPAAAGSTSTRSARSRGQFHESTSKKDIDEMMSLWTANATFTYGPGQTATGKDEIRKVWLDSPGWKPGMHWLADHPAYKLQVTVNGDRGTLHFECHFIDVDTGEVAAITAGDFDVAKIGGRWLITKMVGSTAELVI